MSLASGTALVTGASSGIGEAYARRLAQRGLSVVLVARRLDRLKALADQIIDTYGVSARIIEADLTVDADLGRIEEFLRTGGIDVLVNNAGMGPIASSADLSDDMASATLALNVLAPMRLTRAALHGMQSRKRGTVVNIASVMAFHAMPVTSLYSATKAFMLTYSRAIAQEVSDDGIHMQVVLPAGTITEFYEAAGVSISNFDTSAFMTAEQLVDAALAGLDRGEVVTLPSLQNVDLWSAYDDARAKLFAGTQNGSPAARYLPST